MRISDWSSDVCSSDLVLERARADGVPVRGYVSTVLGCPYQGDVPVADVVRVARALHAMGCYEISLGDTIGVGTPGKARAMLLAVARAVPMPALAVHRSEEHTSELQSLMRISYAVFCLKKKKEQANN